jgi:hypothetical protein
VGVKTVVNMAQYMEGGDIPAKSVLDSGTRG